MQNNVSGFTLVELLIVVSIFMIVVGFGASVDFSYLSSDTFQNEESKIVSVLGRARSHAMANMFESTHGVCYNGENYIIFHDDSCDGSDADENIPANTKIASNVATDFPTFIFERLSGNTTGGIIHITDGVKSADIIINHEGTINW